MKRYALLVFMTLILACTSKPGKGTIIIDVNILDVSTGEIQEHRDVVIDSGRIKSISEHQNDLSPYETMVYGNGKYLMPGLTEMHAHIPHPSEDYGQIENTLFLFLANGVTTIRGMLGHPIHLVLRGNAESGELLSPRIITSSPPLTGNSVTSVEEAISSVTTYQKNGYDFLKIHSGIKREVFDQLVNTADQVGIPFAGHVPADVGIRHALKSKYASIDHLDGFLEGLVPESENTKPRDNDLFGYTYAPLADTSKIDGLVALAKENKVWVVPTQSLFERWISPITADELSRQPEMRYMPSKTLTEWENRKIATINPTVGFNTAQWQKSDTIRKLLIKKLQQDGHGILLGSGASQLFNVPGFSIHREINSLLAAGLTPLEVIQSGTIKPAIFFNKEEVFGQVKEGLEADLILLNANPLEDMGNIQDLSGVFRKGHFTPKVEINKRLAEIAAENREGARNKPTVEKRNDKLFGSWKYYSRKGKKPAPSATFEQIKVLADGYWSMTETNILTNKLDSYQGGSYSLDGSTYSETTTFANSNSLFLLNETLTYELEVKGDTLIKTGINNDNDEVWIRVE